MQLSEGVAAGVFVCGAVCAWTQACRVWIAGALRHRRDPARVSLPSMLKQVTSLALIGVAAAAPMAKKKSGNMNGQ